MALTAQQMREILAQNPQADGIDPDTGTVVYASQLVGDHYVPGAGARARIGAQNPRTAPGAIHRSHIAKRWHLGLPSMGV